MSGNIFIIPCSEIFRRRPPPSLRARRGSALHIEEEGSPPMPSCDVSPQHVLCAVAAFAAASKYWYSPVIVGASQRLRPRSSCPQQIPRKQRELLQYPKEHDDPTIMTGKP